MDYTVVKQADWDKSPETHGAYETEEEAIAVAESLVKTPSGAVRTVVLRWTTSDEVEVEEGCDFTLTVKQIAAFGKRRKDAA